MSDLIQELVEEVKAEIISDNISSRSNVRELQKVPDPDPTLVPDPGLKVVCSICERAELADPYIESKGLAEVEKFKYLRTLADRVGWKYSIINIDEVSQINFICPSCHYGKYNSKSCCPKCSCKKLSSKYNNGTASGLGMFRENIERRCERCGFLFCQNTLDE